MWIRSQDKTTLVTARRITIVPNLETAAKVNGWKVIEYHGETRNGVDWDVLGVYKTKERALEILNTIQSQLRSTVEVVREVESDKYKQCFVFQMPEE